MNKKLLSFITSAVITVSVFPFTVNAADTDPTTGSASQIMTKEEFMDLVISDDSDFSDGGYIYSSTLKFDAVENQSGEYDLIVYGIDPRDVSSGSYHGSEMKENWKDYTAAMPAMFFCGVTYSINAQKDKSAAYTEMFDVIYYIDNTIPGVMTASSGRTIVDASINQPIDIARYIYPVITSGDVDNDGLITASDATLVLQAYSYASTGASMNLNSTLFDYNRDGSINSADATDILEEYAERSTQ